MPGHEGHPHRNPGNDFLKSGLVKILSYHAIFQSLRVSWARPKGGRFLVDFVLIYFKQGLKFFLARWPVVGVGSRCIETVVAVVLWPGKHAGAGVREQHITSAHTMTSDTRVCSEGGLPREWIVVKSSRGKLQAGWIVVTSSRGELHGGSIEVTSSHSELQRGWIAVTTSRGELQGAAKGIRRLPQIGQHLAT